MNTRPLTPFEEANLKALRDGGLDCALLYLTQTGLDKALLDAVQPMRSLFQTFGVHDYAQQRQGPEYKVHRAAVLYSGNVGQELQASLYRPKTKKGDPRIWFPKLPKLASAGNVLAVAVHLGVLRVFNLSTIQRGSGSAVLRFLESLQAGESPAVELLRRLRELSAMGPLQAVCAGTTAIGRTIELALGIAINSRRDPDFKGIEIKSSRTPRSNRQRNRITLFACVPDWPLSRLKSSAQILDQYGYQRSGVNKLYCQVATGKPNSQLLQLEVDKVNDWLREFAAKRPREDVVVWTLDKLHGRLMGKHRETFWIKARSEQVRGREWFHLESVHHTRSPSIVAFDELLDDGAITVDHLIKRDGRKISEKGPLFKIESQRVSDLFVFPERTYDLLAS